MRYGTRPTTTTTSGTTSDFCHSRGGPPNVSSPTRPPVSITTLAGPLLPSPFPSTPRRSTHHSASDGRVGVVPTPGPIRHQLLDRYVYLLPQHLLRDASARAFAFAAIITVMTTTAAAAATPPFTLHHPPYREVHGLLSQGPNCFFVWGASPVAVVSGSCAGSLRGFRRTFEQRLRCERQMRKSTGERGALG